MDNNTPTPNMIEDAQVLREGVGVVIQSMVEEVHVARPQAFSQSDIPELVSGLVEMTTKTLVGQVMHLAGYSKDMLNDALSKQPVGMIVPHAVAKIGTDEYLRAFTQVTQEVMMSFFASLQPPLDKSEQQQIVERVMRRFHQRRGSEV